MNRADALIDEIKKGESGRLTVFLGAAPGVGKTFAMLGRAQELQQQGHRVVLGVVETHGRADTAKLMNGLPKLDPVLITHNNKEISEFNIQAALQCKGAIVLVDEFAHTNAPGSLHRYRWQDVESLLKAGIDVYTTVNVQHLESLNEVVLSLTGVRVRETVPDTLFNHLKDIRLIDLPPNELIERLNQGKVYAPELAAQAITTFFTPSNLAALRELAMDTVARYVDQDAFQKRLANGQDSTPLHKHVLIAVNEFDQANYLLRAGGRLAERRGATWSAVLVIKPGASPHDGQESRVDQIAALVRRLGGELDVVHSGDVVAGILQAAESRKALAILVGRGREKKFARFLNLTLAQQLIKQGARYEITLVGRRSAAKQAASTLSVPGWSTTSSGYLLMAVLATMLAVILSFAAESTLGFKDLSAIFLLAVLLVASRTNPLTASMTALLCFLSYNYFFFEPRYTFHIFDHHGLVTVFVFLVSGLLAGQLASRLRLQIVALKAANRFGVAMQGLTQQLSVAADLNQVMKAGSKALQQVTQAKVWMRIGVLAELPRPAELNDDKVLHAATYSENNQEECGRFTNTLTASAWWFIPLPLGKDRKYGVVAIRYPDQVKQLPEHQRRLIHAMLADIGSAVLRVCLVSELETARVSSETEKLRSALLSSVSHDLRSPLSVMIGAADSLHSFDATLAPQDKFDLIDTIRTEGQRLDRYIQNLLDMTRLGQQGLSLKRDWVLVEDLVYSAAQRLKRYQPDVNIRFQIQTEMPAIHVHPALIEQALFNVLENGAKFSGPKSPLVVFASVTEKSWITIDVADSGPGIPEEERTKIFDMFFTMKRGDRSTQGTGLGLTIVLGIVRSHMGDVEALPGIDGVGTVIRIKLPIQIGE